MANSVFHTDVLIVGGGVAGVGAAVGAAYQGLEVTLIEGKGYPGGCATGAYVATICGLYYRSKSSGPVSVMQGPVRRFGERLAQVSGQQPVSFGEGLWFLPYQRNACLQVLVEMLADCGTQVLLNTTLGRVTKGDDRILEVVAKGSVETRVILPRTVIDCSGDACIGSQIGHALHHDPTYQAGAQVFTLHGLQGLDDRTVSLQLIRGIREGLASGMLPETCSRVSMVPGSYREGEANFKLGLPMEIGEYPDRVSLHVEASGLVEVVLDYLRGYVPAFRRSELKTLAPEVGIRTGLRYCGAGVLSKEDILNCYKSQESIARGAWPIEIWRVGEGPEMGYFAEMDHYDVPAACLESTECGNLWFGGKLISADEGGIASARVIGTAMATGFAAGALAAARLTDVPREHRIRQIQYCLQGEGGHPWQ